MEEVRKFYQMKQLEATCAAFIASQHPLLVDEYLGEAIELDVDAVCDGKEVYIGAIMEHLEEAAPPEIRPVSFQHRISLMRLQNRSENKPLTSVWV